MPVPPLNIRDVNRLVSTQSEFTGAQSRNLSRIFDDLLSRIEANENTAAQTSGWANYSDTQYTSGAPFSLSADTDTVLPNNAGSKIETQLPSDVTSFYSGGKITGRNGDGILITLDLIAVPTSANTTYIEFWFDIGGSVGELYRRIISFPKGNGVVRPINFTVAGYTLDTWASNGATTYVRANGTANLYGMRYVITRTHKAA